MIFGVHRHRTPAILRVHINGRSWGQLVLMPGKFCQITEGTASKLPAFAENFLGRKRQTLSCMDFSQRPAEDRRGEDKTFVGVDPVRGGEHGGLRALPGIAESLKDLFVRLVCMVPPETEKFPEPWDQGSAAVQKCKKVHIRMRTGIIPVYKSRLRGC